MDLSLQTILYRLAAMLVLVGVHGFAVALVSGAFGANEPRYDGRLSPNPLVHLDLLAVIPFILCQIGWIRPVAIDGKNLRGGRSTLWAIALLGLLLTLAVVMLIWLARPWLVSVIPNATAAAATTSAIRVLLETTTWFTIFNLLPITPLTMGMVLSTISAPAATLVERHALLVRIALVLAALAAGSFLRPVFVAVLDLVSLGRM